MHCCHYTTSAPPPQKKKRHGKELAGTSGMLLASLSGATHQLHHRRRKSYSMMPHVGMDCMLALVSSQQLDSESGLNISAFMCGFICVCVCVWFVCMFVDANARGTPNHPVFHPVLFLPYSFLTFLSSVSLSFGHLASVNRPSDRSAQTAQSYWPVWL